MFGKKDNTTNISENLLYKTALKTYHISSAVLASSPEDIDEALLFAAKLEDSTCLFNLLYDEKILAYFIGKLDKKDENIEKLIRESCHFNVASLFQETIKTEAVHRIENKVKKTSEKNMITEAMEYLALSEVEQGVREVRYESNYISSELTHKPSSPIMLLALKCRNRLQKNQVFNGFVLKRSYGKKSCEFAQFSNELHASIKNIPPNTRLQLAVETGNTLNHWTAVDLFIDQSGVLHSFVLDASNSGVVSEDLSGVLAKQFPNGKHYIYKAQQLKPIHADLDSCLIFTLSHLTQLSKINSEDLYERELPAIAVPSATRSPHYSAYSAILTEKFVAGSLLIPLIRSAQTTQKLQKATI